MTLWPSWVLTANSKTCPFPLNNLPYGVFSTAGKSARCGVAIGDMILDMKTLESSGMITLANAAVFAKPRWNEFMELGNAAWSELRNQLKYLLTIDAPDADQAKLRPMLVAINQAQMHMPFRVAEYTDFYSGMQHAKNMGAILRGSPDLPANWLHIPIGYNGRASSVVISGTELHRPMGQTKAADADMPVFGPCKRLDIELELGAIVGCSSTLGQGVSVAQAEDMIFGYVLLNDWSARDIQAWEYQPLGPFQAKAFGTSISPWIVTTEALAVFRTPTPKREQQLLPYLAETRPGLYDINLQVFMQPEGAVKATKLTETNYSRMYYSAAQQLAHHTSSGCNMNVGDLLGSGTISGPTISEYGSLVELSWAGKKPFTLDTGETRTFIEDGDTLTLQGKAVGDGYTIGFGECSGKILPTYEIKLTTQD